MTTAETPRPPFPSFDVESATKKVRLADDAWNTRLGAATRRSRVLSELGL